MTKFLRKALVAVAAVASCVVFVPQSAFACHVDEAAFKSIFRGDLNQDLNDYGRILADGDSNDRNCAEAADYALTNKVTNTPSSTWGEWLQAGNAALVFAAANRIGANGFATQQLDTAVRSILPTLAVGHNTSLPCAKESFNQCVDDYSVAAPGFAWAAAYRYRRGDSPTDVTSLVNQAKGAIQAAFNEVCIRAGDATTFCNGTTAQLNAGTAYTLSLEHGQQMPSYGFGLMTSVVSAARAMEAAQGDPNYVYQFPDDQKIIAQGLAREMLAHVDATANTFKSDCINSMYQDINGVWHTSGAVNCAGPDQYDPKLYELKEAYTRYFGGMPNTSAYQADTNSFSTSVYHLQPNDGDAVLCNNVEPCVRYSWGRYEYYYGQSYDWINTPREYLPFDANNPIGYIDGIDPVSGLAFGWTCDWDAPQHSNRVDLYANGQFAAYAYATLASEQAVSDACHGGTAHRWQTYLPSWTRGLPIAAYGLDYTWYGFTQLTCDNLPSCSGW